MVRIDALQRMRTKGMQKSRQELVRWCALCWGDSERATAENHENYRLGGPFRVEAIRAPRNRRSIHQAPARAAMQNRAIPVKTNRAPVPWQQSEDLDQRGLWT